ncbi:MAG: CotH kinase family protein [Verrucomicrobia bacterium]|nr:CotH kinase family protein [Verrucomicrobiota bacterium]
MTPLRLSGMKPLVASQAAGLSQREPVRNVLLHSSAVNSFLRWCWLTVTILAAATNFSAGQSASEKFFSSGTIPHLHLQIAKTNLAQLRERPRDYVRATIRAGDKIYEDIGIHLKGAAGSFRDIDNEKPAFTLNFDKFVDDQKFHGLDKLSLNNSVQDPSYMTEAICSELFLAAGVPTTRTAHARVSLNGRELGLYVLKEGFDKTFLRRHFKNPRGNLYDSGFLRDINEPLERTSGDGDVRSRADLKALVAATTEADPTARLERIRALLDLERFLDFAALEMLTGHWDGYVMKKNNYRVYHDPDSGKLVFFPHGMDQMFLDVNAPVVPRAQQVEGLVARAIFETAEGRKIYRERTAQIVTNLFTAQRLTNHINALQARIRPILESLGKNDHLNHDSAVNGLRNNVTQRVRSAAQKLFEPPPNPVRFDDSGFASLTNWQKLDVRGTGKLALSRSSDDVRSLHIAAGPDGRCTASWRTRLLLPRGLYVFEGRVKTAGVVPLEKDTASKGVGAGLRQSQRQSRKHGFIGDNDWQIATHEFAVTAEDEETVILCELRAEKGEAWFDLGSLKLKRSKPASAPAP